MVITKQAIGALVVLFDLKKWAKLPHQTVLDRDSDYTLVATKYELKNRNQTQRQFVKWRNVGSPAEVAAAALTDDNIQNLINSRVPEHVIVPLVVSAFKTVLDSNFTKRRPSGALSAVKLS